MDEPQAPRGRGAISNPQNRFERIEYEPDPEAEPDDRVIRTEFFSDPTRQIITRNDSPDVGFETSVNPYRGCEHGCIYCFARPTHEYLGMSAGLDFETRILVKEQAPELLRDELASPGWQPQVVVMSGVTDPYQPIERKLEVTRRCLAVLAEFRNPVTVITKNHLVTRDIDHLGELAAHHGAAVVVSITSLDDDLRRRMEPRTSIPRLRLEAIRKLNDAGIPAGVNVAPIIPGITDHEIPRILEAAAEAGARFAGYTMLRLPWAVKDLFAEWLEQHFPDRKEKVLNRLRSLRDGKLNDPNFGTRMHGHGPFAEQVSNLFEISRRKAGIPPDFPSLSVEAFRKPHTRRGQLNLF